jgi:hypothetical protein
MNHPSVKTNWATKGKRGRVREGTRPPNAPFSETSLGFNPRTAGFAAAAPQLIRIRDCLRHPRIGKAQAPANSRRCRLRSDARAGARGGSVRITPDPPLGPETAAGSARAGSASLAPDPALGPEPAGRYPASFQLCDRVLISRSQRPEPKTGQHVGNRGCRSRSDRRGHGGRQTRPQGRQTRPRRATDAASGTTDATTGGDRRICRSTLASAYSGGGDRRSGDEHHTRLLIDFVK